MATRDVYLSGKAHYPKLTQPDTKFDASGQWNLKLYLDGPSLEKFNEMKSMPGGIKNHIKMDDDGQYVVLKRPVKKEYKGKITTFAPPTIFDGSKKLPDGGYMPLEGGVLIGNGSDVTCKVAHYSYLDPQKKNNWAIRLESVRVDNLVPYTKKDFTDEQTKGSKGLEDQPQPVWG